MATFHQTGFVHGPHPKALRIGVSGERKQTDEVAIKIDFRNPAMIVRLEEGVEIYLLGLAIFQIIYGV